jgi:hypothetical protein
LPVKLYTLYGTMTVRRTIVAVLSMTVAACTAPTPSGENASVFPYDYVASVPADTVQLARIVADCSKNAPGFTDAAKGWLVRNQGKVRVKVGRNLAASFGAPRDAGLKPGFELDLADLEAMPGSTGGAIPIWATLVCHVLAHETSEAVNYRINYGERDKAGGESFPDYSNWRSQLFVDSHDLGLAAENSIRQEAGIVDLRDGYCKSNDSLLIAIGPHTELSFWQPDLVKNSIEYLDNRDVCSERNLPKKQ